MYPTASPLHPSHFSLQPAAPRLLSAPLPGPGSPQRNTKRQAGGRNTQQRCLIEIRSVGNFDHLHVVSGRLVLKLVVGEESVRVEECD